MPVPERLEHSVLEMPLEVGDGAVDRVAGPNPLEHLGVSEPADPPSASHPRIHSEVSGDGRNGQQDHMCEEITLRDIKPCSHVCHISWIYVWGNCGQKADLRYNCTSRHDVKGFLKTSVVLPPDSEIVAPF